MILSNNRRHRLLYLALAGMDVAWSLPWVDFFVGRWFGGAVSSAGGALSFGSALASPPMLLLFFWGALVAYMVAADWLNRRHVLSPMRELWIVALVVATTFLAQILLVYGPTTLQGSAWLGNLADSVLNFNRGLQPALVVLGYNLFLWWRVAYATGQGINFHAVGFSFRIGMLLGLFGCGLLALLDGANGAAIFYLLAFFGFGLTASALSRLDDKAWVADGSTGALLPWGRFGQLVGSVLLTLLGALAVGALLSPGAWGVYWRGMRPVFGLFAPVFAVLLTVLGWILTPVGWAMEWIVNSLRGWLNVDPEAAEAISGGGGQPPDMMVSTMLAESPIMRYALIAAGILLALGMIWIFFVRTVGATRRDEVEETLPDEGIDDEASSGSRRRWGLFGLARRFGFSQQLLAAISVQNLYANLTRLATRRGFPRPEAMPPDRYLSTLERAFPGQEEGLARLTNAYMRVHYGEAPASSDELEQLRGDYEAIRGSIEMTVAQ